MTLAEDIEHWDGRSAADIGAIFQRHFEAAGFSDDLVGLVDTESLQTGATWLLKHWLEAGNPLHRGAPCSANCPHSESGNQGYMFYKALALSGFVPNIRLRLNPSSAQTLLQRLNS